MPQTTGQPQRSLLSSLESGRDMTAQMAHHQSVRSTSRKRLAAVDRETL